MGYGNYSSLDPAGIVSVTATSAAAVGFTMPSTSYIVAASAGGAARPGPNYAIISVQAASARWRDDGTAPTVGFGGGVAIPANGILYYDGKVSAIQFICDTGTAYISAALYRAGQ